MPGIRRALGRVKRLILGKPASTGMPWSELGAALARMQALGISPKTVFDVGASDGQWTAEARKVFPHARYVLVEAQPHHKPALERYVKANPNTEFVMAAAGDHEGEVSFLVTPDPYGGRATNDATEGEAITVPCVTLDSLATKLSCEPPFLIKMDTHGFEAPILEGAKTLLPETCAVIVEAYNFQIAKESLRFHEMCAYMEARGFRCLDVFDAMHREKDGALWQFDMVFAPAALSVFDYNGFA